VSESEKPEEPVSSEEPAAEASSEETASKSSEEAPAAGSAPGGSDAEAGDEAGEAPAEVPEPVAESPAEPLAEDSRAEEAETAPPAEVAEEAPAEVAEEAPAEVAAEAPAEVAAEAAPAEVAEVPVAESVSAPAAEEDIVVVDPTTEVVADVEYIEEDETPRAKPAIPGADLVPDIVPEGDQYLDAEARAAAEAEAEEAARRAGDDEPEIVAQPIADAAINLAAGARYTATGKRKTAVARVIVKPGTGHYSINGKSLEEFFPRETLQRIIRQPLEAVGYEARMDVIARMHGGGVSAQAGALRHGISRALLEADPHLRGELKRRGFLTRDPRVKERKKAGLKKARKRPQFSKR
jgi:small subunit ribosomal protein S9